METETLSFSTEQNPTPEILDSKTLDKTFQVTVKFLSGRIKKELSPTIGSFDAAGKWIPPEGQEADYEGITNENKILLSHRLNLIKQTIDHYNHAVKARKTEGGSYNQETGEYHYHDSETNQDISGRVETAYLIDGLELMAEKGENEALRNESLQLLAKLTPSIKVIISPNQEGSEKEIFSYEDWRKKLIEEARKKFSDYETVPWAKRRTYLLTIEEEIRQNNKVSFECLYQKSSSQQEEKPSSSALESNFSSPEKISQEAVDLAKILDEKLEKEGESFLKEIYRLEEKMRNKNLSKEEKTRLETATKTAFQIFRARAMEIQENDSKAVGQMKILLKTMAVGELEPNQIKNIRKILGLEESDKPLTDDEISQISLAFFSSQISLTEEQTEVLEEMLKTKKLDPVVWLGKPFYTLKDLIENFQQNPDIPAKEKELIEVLFLNSQNRNHLNFSLFGKAIDQATEEIRKEIQKSGEEITTPSFPDKVKRFLDPRHDPLTKAFVLNFLLELFISALAKEISEGAKNN